MSRRALLAAMGIAGGTSVFGALTLAPESADAAGWGGYENGKIPTSALSAIPWSSSYYLRSDAVTALVDLNKRFRAAKGADLPINSAYRTYAEQQHWKDYWTGQGSPQNAATPGTSNHGWALAIDIGVGIHDWTNPIYIWMKDNAGDFKWNHPAWAEPNGSIPEAWHWEFSGSYTGPPAQQQIKDEELAILISASTAKYNGVWLAAPGYWHLFTGEEYTQFTAHGLNAGLKTITAANDRDLDVLRDTFTKQTSL